MTTASSADSPSRKSRPSLRNLAKQLKVSHTTVNMGLKEDPRISPALREKIRRTAKQQGYFPNDLATVLRTGRTRLIGCIVPAINSAYISGFLEPAMGGLWEAGYFPITLCSQLDPRNEAKMLESLARLRVEGVLIMPSREDRGKRHFAELLRDHIPIVAINNPIPKLELPLVASDDAAGAETATRHLISLGHCRILHIGAPHESRYSDLRREQGYRQAMTAAGLVPTVLYYEDRLQARLPLAALKMELLQKPPTQRPTAILCYHDSLALRLYAFCDRVGMQIPDDLSVIGFSNEGWGEDAPHALDFVNPPLSTVEQNSAQIGATAVQCLLALIGNEQPDASRMLIEPVFIERESTQAPRPVGGEGPLPADAGTASA